ncbi:response regulators consisting of a CheY-like receiver domain and a winged-helix DNA-binding domain [Clostridium sp. CAG:1000]|jgi:DNA-binding response OmpR family regulator|nr:response regulators consisting of a CheY-like receiver domain and a winged-helix DNA-binding domain [Clostridium sp. CAG:1000]
MKVLLVEDNSNIRESLEYSFSENNIDLVSKSCINDTIEYLDYNKVDAVILDVTLPDGNGFDLYKHHIMIKDIPTIFLTANDAEEDIVKAFEMGASDYITKPFRTLELIARLNRILNKKIIKVKDIIFDMNKMIVYKNDKVVNLTSLELKILNLLFNNINKVVSRDKIIESIWEWTGNDVNDNTVTVYMKRIREKLGSDIIVTIKGLGYRVDE